MPIKTEADWRLEINKKLEKAGWKLTGKDKNVFVEHYSSGDERSYADYSLWPKHWENPLIILEAKKPGEDLKKALEQVKRDAKGRKAPIVYVVIGSAIKTLHLKNNQPLLYNREEVDFILDENTALKYIDTNEYNPQETVLIKSRKELIGLFRDANIDLKEIGLLNGSERFSEFSTILFLKLLSEQEEDLGKDRRRSKGKIIPEKLRWSYFQSMEGKDLLEYVNKVLACPAKHSDKEICCFQKKYGDDIFKPLSKKWDQDPTILKGIVSKLSSLRLSEVNSDVKGDAFEYLLKVYSNNAKRDWGEYFTPRHLVKFLVKLAKPRFGEKIYDPFCGTGGILTEAFKWIKNEVIAGNKEKKLKKSQRVELQKSSVYGNEITSVARVAKMSMILVGDGQNNIQEIDSLNKEKNPVDNRYHLVITNMPFGSKRKRFKYLDYEWITSNGDSIHIEHCFNAVNKDYRDGRIIMIVPEGVLFDKKKLTKLREKIYENSYVECIISLPRGAFAPYAPNAKANILYLTKIKQPKEKQKFVWYYDVKNDGYTLNSKREAKKGINDLDIFWSLEKANEADRLARGLEKLKMEEIEGNSYVSIPRLYKEAVFEKEDDKFPLEQLIEEVKITVLMETRLKIEKEIDLAKKNIFTSSNPDGDLEVAFNKKFRGMIAGAKNWKDYLKESKSIADLNRRSERIWEVINEQEKQNGTELITGFPNIGFPIWSVTKDKNFVLQEKKFKERIASEDISDYLVVPPQHFSYRPPGIDVGYICFNNKQETGCVTSYYPVFRVKDGKRVIPEYLYCVLQSEKFREQTKLTGSARASSTFSEFCKIRVPIPSLKEQERVVEKLNKIRENIQNAQKVIDNLNSSLSLMESRRLEIYAI